VFFCRRRYFGSNFELDHSHFFSPFVLLQWINLLPGCTMMRQFLWGSLFGFLFGSVLFTLFHQNVSPGLGFYEKKTTALQESSSSSSLSSTNPKKQFLAKGDRYEIFYVDKPDVAVAASNSLLFVGPPQDIIQRLVTRYDWLDTITQNVPRQTTNSSQQRARLAYLEMIKSMVSGTVYLEAEVSIKPILGVPLATSQGTLNWQSRQKGGDWTYLGDTMTGWKRIDNVHALLQDVMEHNIPGDYIETGVWRGGSSMFARAVMLAYGQPHRKSYVCDSFSGLPPQGRPLHKGDKGWDNTPYLEVHQDIVVDGFDKYSLLDENVIFVKGFFNDTMPHVRPLVESVSVMRLDGDMYESTVDVLYHLYDKLSVGGYVIMDDWFGFPSKQACEDFFAVHKISPQIVRIDDLSAYWQKTEQVEIQYWRYEQLQFK